MTTDLQSTGRPTTPAPRAAAAVAGLSAVALAIYQVATPGSPGATYDSVLDWVREVLFLAFLVASVLAVAGAHRAGLAPLLGVRLLGIGYGAIALGVAYGMVVRDDPDWFFVLAGPGNLLAVAAFVVWSVWAVRRRVMPLWAGLMCGLGGATAILFAEFGTSVLVAGFWFWLASRSPSSTRSR